MTIRAALIVNNHGKPRLTKFYTQLPASRQQALIKEIFRLVSKRPDGVCNFLDATELTALLPPPADAVRFSSALGGSKGKQVDKPAYNTASSSSASSNNQDQLRVIYRHYATLYFVFVYSSRVSTGASRTCASSTSSSTLTTCTPSSTKSSKAAWWSRPTSTRSSPPLMPPHAHARHQLPPPDRDPLQPSETAWAASLLPLSIFPSQAHLAPPYLGQREPSWWTPSPTLEISTSAVPVAAVDP
ncbi:hypothetical protein Golomagni_06523 [Golovinomyces magnicellulatus]|nr:hypothetical protein Golomagni_06523 [Golovinomyces magnicellulatus]